MEDNQAESSSAELTLQDQPRIRDHLLSIDVRFLRPTQPLYVLTQLRFLTSGHNTAGDLPIDPRSAMAAPRPKRLVGVSTKMYFGVTQTKNYVETILTKLSLNQQLLNTVDVFVIPDFISLSSVTERVRGKGLLIGAQDSYFEDKGAFTGEVSPAQLREVGCDMVELGHAERRRLFHETDEEAGMKAAAACRNGMVPLVCIGEKTKGEIQVAVSECQVQVQAVTKAVPDDADIVLAYEPVWAIGKAEPAGADHVVGVTKELRRLTQTRKGLTRILYGGSAGPGLFAKLSEGVDGLFLGRFAHDPDQFLKSIEEIAAT